MGHTDQKMIMQIYDHVTSERETKAIEKLNALFPKESDENWHVQSGGGQTIVVVDHRLTTIQSILEHF